jgi:hypothetical protein
MYSIKASKKLLPLPERLYENKLDLLDLAARYPAETR